MPILDEIDPVAVCPTTHTAAPTQGWLIWGYWKNWETTLQSIHRALNTQNVALVEQCAAPLQIITQDVELKFMDMGHIGIGGPITKW